MRARAPNSEGIDFSPLSTYRRAKNCKAEEPKKSNDADMFNDMKGASFPCRTEVVKSGDETFIHSCGLLSDILSLLILLGGSEAERRRAGRKQRRGQGGQEGGLPGGLC